METTIIKYFIICLLISSFGAKAYAQNDPNHYIYTNNNNISIEIMDKNIISLLNRKDEIDKNTPLEGYKIQIFSGPSRINASNLQAKFALYYPNINSYILYDGANYKLRVGDFIFYQNAETFRKKLYDKFNIALIVKDTINKQYDSDLNKDTSDLVNDKDDINDENNTL